MDDLGHRYRGRGDHRRRLALPLHLDCAAAAAAGRAALRVPLPGHGYAHGYAAAHAGCKVSKSSGVRIGETTVVKSRGMDPEGPRLCFSFQKRKYYSTGGTRHFHWAALKDRYIRVKSVFFEKRFIVLSGFFLNFVR